MKGSACPSLFPLQYRCKTLHLVDNLRKHVHACGLSKKIELVITSPLLRAMQTAAGVFGGGDYTDGLSVTPVLMVANAGNNNRSAISSLNSPPFVAVELCGERLGVRSCNKRRSVSEYEALFPAIDFSLIESNEDILWKADVREANEEVEDRGKKFIDCFENCELHSIVMVGKSVIGSGSSETNYPGKIPGGLDLPSDSAPEKHSENGTSNYSA